MVKVLNFNFVTVFGWEKRVERRLKEGACRGENGGRQRWESQRGRSRVSGVLSIKLQLLADVGSG